MLSVEHQNSKQQKMFTWGVAVEWGYKHGTWPCCLVKLDGRSVLIKLLRKREMVINAVLCMLRP